MHETSQEKKSINSGSPFASLIPKQVTILEMRCLQFSLLAGALFPSISEKGLPRMYPPHSPGWGLRARVRLPVAKEFDSLPQKRGTPAVFFSLWNVGSVKLFLFSAWILTASFSHAITKGKQARGSNSSRMLFIIKASKNILFHGIKSRATCKLK